MRVEAEKLTNRSLAGFKKKIKVDKLLEGFRSAIKEYDAFIDHKHSKENQLERKKDEAGDKLADHLEGQSKIYGWDREVERGENLNSYETIIRDACNQEAITNIKQSDLGSKYLSMDIVEEQSKIALYKGDPLDVAVGNINGLMKQVGIVYFNPKIPQITSK